MKIIEALERYKDKKEQITFCPIIDGSRAFILAKILTEISAKNILYVASDDLALVELIASLKFFLPEQNIVHLPAWDSLPYDRVSPGLFTLSRRINALSEISDNKDNKLLVLTTASSMLQKVMPENILQDNKITIKKGDQLDLNLLSRTLISLGYIRMSNATAPGEFAVRGSIVDIIVGYEEEGWRIDFFGNQVESIKAFDPVDQLTNRILEKVVLLPASEVIITDEYVTNFRQNYLQEFGAGHGDPIYEAVSDKRRYAGLEHWLPFFYNQLDTIFDYADFGVVIYGHDLNQIIEEKLKTISEYYQARIDMGKQKNKDSQLASNGSLPYKPVKPNDLWCQQEEINSYLQNQLQINLSEFIHHSSENVFNLAIKKTPIFLFEANKLGCSVFEVLKTYLKNNKQRKIIIACYSEGSRSRITNMLSDHFIAYKLAENWQECEQLGVKLPILTILPIEHGFELDELTLISEQELLGERLHRAKKSKARVENFLQDATSLSQGEIVVHRDHGIGRFEGLETLDVLGIKHDCLRIIYDNNDKLFIPVENIEVITRYGSNDENAALDRLGTASWQNRKARLKNRIKEIAEQLLQTAAEREINQAQPLVPVKGLYEEFCARFPHAETEDQLAAIEAIAEDLSSGKPMDRLICGDVGFGKTEVAVRASFITCFSEKEAGDTRKQVAIIAPTTLLARQHYQTFCRRFEGFPVKIAQLSRLATAKEASKTKELLASGEIDIVIGTHALLANEINFNNLSLLVIDEEQHFGVAQKEKLKELRTSVHVLTMSATPIPRTMQMSLAGIKEMSLITTPPVDRMAVTTFVMPIDQVVIKEAILREYNRGGKIFYVCPRISDLSAIETMLKDLVPSIKVITAHGQMAPQKLDDLMNDFYDGDSHVLLSTTIVESGLDVPSANTIIIHKADNFGLSQLYQLRGRVGRGKIRAYAYLTFEPRKPLSTIAKKRLEIMQSLDYLGAGFSLASHDMDLRGFGNLVGEEQSGNIREVGFELYQEMLQEAVENLVHNKDKEAPEDISHEQWSPQINCGLSVLIPEEYVQDLTLRLNLYRRMSSLLTEVEFESFAAEMIDRFGPLPKEVEHLLSVLSLKQLCKKYNIEKLDAGPKAVVLAFRKDKIADPDKLLKAIGKYSNKLKIRPDHKLVIAFEEQKSDKKLSSVYKLVQKYMDEIV